MEDVFALGDCAGFLEQSGRKVLPALAQVITNKLGLTPFAKWIMNTV